MDQPIGSGQDLNEGAEVDDLAHGSFVYFADLGLGGDSLHHLDGLFRSLFVDRSDAYRAVVFDVHFDPSRFNDAADHFAARADDLTNLLGLDLQGHDPRRMPRSEEHTSELQSPCNLVCRLLLEKKKTELDANESH